MPSQHWVTARAVAGEAATAPPSSGAWSDTPFRREDWAACFATQPEEFEYWVQDEDIEGEVPQDLKGTLFRNGPGNFERGGQRFRHYLDGDGYVSAFSLVGGRVHYRSRYVRTEEFGREEEEDRVGYRTTFGTQREGGPLANAFDFKLKNSANTSVVDWGGQLLCMYEAGVPHRLDRHTLATLGPSSLGGLVREGMPFTTKLGGEVDAALGLGHAVTAHFHEDPHRQRLVGWAWGANVNPANGLAATDLVLNMYEFGAGWEVLAEREEVLPRCPLAPHDFALSEGWAVMFQNPLDFNPVPYAFGLKGPAECLNFSAGAPMVAHMIPRGGGARVSIPLPPHFLIHHANAWEDADGTVNIVSSGWGGEYIRPDAGSAGILGSWETVLEGDFSTIPRTNTWLTRLHPATGEGTVELIMERCGEHPHVNPLFAMLESRYYYIGAAPTRDTAAPPQATVRLDGRSGEQVVFLAGDRVFTEEPIVVPRGGAEDPEDFVWVLQVHYDAEAGRSGLAIFDGQRVADGPVARVWLRHAIPHGLHGAYGEYAGPQGDSET